jgi:hypothetical protein
MGKTGEAVALFNYFLREYETIGPYTLHPVKTRVALLTRIRFASVNRLGRNFLNGHLVLVTRHSSPLVSIKVENLNDRFFVHHFRLTSGATIDGLSAS